MCVCVDVLTGRAARTAGHAAHPLRAGTEGASSPVIREDGAMAWRCAIQRNSPAAARLTWWELTIGVVELSRVGHHDDYKPR